MLRNVSGEQYGVQTGDVVKATIVGNVISAYKNGVLMGTATDSTFATGSPGMGFNTEDLSGHCIGTNADYGYTSYTAAAIGSGSFVQANSGPSTIQSSNSSVAVSYLNPQTAGNLNILVAGWGDNTSSISKVTDTQGNTYILRSIHRNKDGKDHRYFSIVENHRLASNKTVQRTVVYLGEINDEQQAAWRKTLSVFDEEQQGYANLSLFPDDRKIPADAVDSVQVKLSSLELRRPRVFGSCWLGCELWRQLGLHEFWDSGLAGSREDVAWEKVLPLLVVNRLLDPGSEFRVPRQWYLSTAMDALRGTDFAVAEKDRLDRCLDRVLEHKQELFLWLRQKWADLFHAEFAVLLYDLTSTYFEGAREENPKAKYGHSRDKRTDCLQGVIGLVITTDGFPLAYEVMDGNTSDRATLRGFLDKIEKTYGKAKRMWVMDRGIPSEEILREMRDPAREIFYLGGEPQKARSNRTKRSGWICPGRKCESRWM